MNPTPNRLRKTNGNLFSQDLLSGNDPQVKEWKPILPNDLSPTFVGGSTTEGSPPYKRDFDSNISLMNIPDTQLQVQTSLSLVIDSTLCFYWRLPEINWSIKVPTTNCTKGPWVDGDWYSQIWMFLGYGSILISSISSKLGGRCIFGRLGIRGYAPFN